MSLYVCSNICIYKKKKKDQFAILAVAPREEGARASHGFSGSNLGFLGPNLKNSGSNLEISSLNMGFLGSNQVVIVRIGAVTSLPSLPSPHVKRAPARVTADVCLNPHDTVSTSPLIPGHALQWYLIVSTSPLMETVSTSPLIPELEVEFL